MGPMQKHTILIDMIQAARILESRNPVQTAAIAPTMTNGIFATEARSGL